MVYGKEQMKKFILFQRDFNLKSKRAKLLEKAQKLMDKQDSYAPDTVMDQDIRLRFKEKRDAVQKEAKKLREQAKNLKELDDSNNIESASDVFSLKRVLSLLSTLQDKKTHFLQFNEGNGLKIKTFMKRFQPWDEKLAEYLAELEIISEAFKI